MHRDGVTTVIMGNYRPGAHLVKLLESVGTVVGGY
jgi:hypothetical protein